MTNKAVPGPIAFFSGHLGNGTSATLAPAGPNNGFMLYLKGHIYMFELTGGAVPAAGTVWTCRDMVGILYGGTGPFSNSGAYQYFPAPFLPFTAPEGSAFQFSFAVNNQAGAGHDVDPDERAHGT